MNDRELAERMKALKKYSRDAVARYLAVTHVLPIDWQALNIFERYCQTLRLKVAVNRFARLRKRITPARRARWERHLFRKEDKPLLRSLFRTRKLIDRLAKLSKQPVSKAALNAKVKL